MQYIPLRINTIQPDTTLPFDLYIFFKETYIPYVKQGGSIEKGKHKKLKRQKIAKFYLPSTSEEKYQSYMDQLLDTPLDNLSLSPEEKHDYVESSCEQAVESLNTGEITERKMNMVKKAANNLNQLLKTNKDALKQIFNPQGQEAKSIIKHCFRVSALSLKFATRLELPQDSIDKVALAGLLHDLGLAHMGPEIQQAFYENPDKLRGKAKLDYLAHAKYSVDLIEKTTVLDPMVLDLIKNHKETIDGEGPNKLRKLSLEQACLNISNLYDKQIVQGNTPQQAIKDIEIDLIGKFDLPFIKKFTTLLKEDFS